MRGAELWRKPPFDLVSDKGTILVDLGEIYSSLMRGEEAVGDVECSFDKKVSGDEALPRPESLRIKLVGFTSPLPKESVRWRRFCG